MCEWFTYLGLEDQLLEDVLLRPSHSIVKQIDSHFLPAEHAFFDLSKHQPSAIFPPSEDGGLALMRGSTRAPKAIRRQEALHGGQGGGRRRLWAALGEPTCGVQGHQPPPNDLVLKSLARGVKTRSAVAHVRAGTGLTPVVETNCHPFTYGRHLFCHNGVLGSFHLFRPLLLSNLPLRYQMSFLGTRCRTLARTIRSTSPPCTFTT